MYAFEGRSSVERGAFGQTEQGGGLDHQERAESLAAAQKRMAHRRVEAGRGGIGAGMPFEQFSKANLGGARGLFDFLRERHRCSKGSAAGQGKNECPAIVWPRRDCRRDIPPASPKDSMHEPIDKSRSDQAVPREVGATAHVLPVVSTPMVTLASPELLARLAAALTQRPAPHTGREQSRPAMPPAAVVGTPTHTPSDIRPRQATAFAGLGQCVAAAQWSPAPHVPTATTALAVAVVPAESVRGAGTTNDWTSGLDDLFDVDAATAQLTGDAAAQAATAVTPAPMSTATASVMVESVAQRGADAPAGGPASVFDAASSSPHQMDPRQAAAVRSRSPFALRPRDVLWTPDHTPTKAPAGAPSSPTMAAAVAATSMPDRTARDLHPERAGGHFGLLALLRKSVRFVAIALVAWFLTMLAAIAAFRFVDPPGSMLMLTKRLTGTPIEQRWVPLRAISPNVVRAVIVSEDGRFCRHWGIDPLEMADAIARARDGVPRGASTVTMQVAKNLFLWPSKSYVRKALEMPLTLAIEVLWSKSRILEVYLNIAEWGPGVFGIEAASRHHFAKGAAKLSELEAALLAVALPNPIQRDAGDPGIGTLRLARAIQARMRSAGRAASCIVRSR